MASGRQQMARYLAQDIRRYRNPLNVSFPPSMNSLWLIGSINMSADLKPL